MISRFGSLVLRHDAVRRHAAAFFVGTGGRCSSSRFSSSAMTSSAAPQTAQDDKLTLPSPDGHPKTYPPKIVKLVDEIALLNLLEVADLNSLLKSKLNISDAPVMMAGFAGAPGASGGGAAAAPAEEEEEAAPAATVQTSFTLKLTSFDTAKKVALIKELKSQVEGMNLVQAKKFVESAPAVVKSEIAKDEAENLKKVLEAAGAVCVIE